MDTFGYLLKVLVQSYPNIWNFSFLPRYRRLLSQKNKQIKGRIANHEFGVMNTGSAGVIVFCREILEDFLAAGK